MIFVLILSPQSTARLLPLRCSQKSRQAGRETWRIFRGFYLRAVVLAATLALEACIGNAVAQQPRMYAVLDAQRTARAPHPTRVAIAPALTLVNQAIDETNAGIRYA